MSKLFSVGIMIAATAYIVADSEEEAKKKAEDLPHEGLEFLSSRVLIGSTKHAEDIYMTGESYHADMPTISLSPAMTIHSRDYRTLDLVEDFDEEERVIRA
jgi:hypothetical protein